MVDFTSRISASALTNSVYTIAAPNRLQSSLKPISVTSSIGAKNTGFCPNSISPIFISGAKLRIFSDIIWLIANNHVLLYAKFLLIAK
jgi:hypothetical protein